MDNKLIQQYGEDILCYRLRTARQKKRMQYKDFDRQLIQLHKEAKVLYEQKWNLGWESIIPPVQKGWKRFFVLREDVARSRQAEFFEKILRKINTYEWSYRKNFVVSKRKKRRRIHVVKEQKLLEPCEWHFVKLGFNVAEQQMFREEWSYGKQKKEPVKRYVFNEPWRFVLRVRPNMITKMRIKDSVLESRMNEINSYLERNDLEWKQRKLLDGNCRWRHRDWEKYNEGYYYKSWPLQKIFDHLKEEI
ncbi:MAG: hypothetical protein WDN26_23095 [Chitinophagaceae bacterium]